MEAIKKRRSVLKGQMTKILSFAEAIDASTSVDEIKARLEKTGVLWTEFANIEVKLFEAQPDAASQSDEFDDNYYHAVALLNAALRQYHTMTNLNTSAHHGDTTCQNQIGSNEAKLPRLQIPIFQGDLQEWQSFFDLFNSSVHDKVMLASAQKLQYLKGLLKGEPLGLIKHLNITDANYIEAYQILVKRYDKKKLTINNYIETFCKQSSVTRVNASTIRKLADTSEEIIRGLKATGPQGDLRDPWLIYIIVNKLDDDSRQFWQHESSKVDHPTFQDLIDCLQTRADTIEGIRETSSRPIMRLTPNLRGLHTNITSNLMCPLCQIDHMLYHCPKFRTMNLNDRRTFITEKGRCYNCLSDSHTVKTCRATRSCQICHKRHNSLLHMPNMSKSQSISQPLTLPGTHTIKSLPKLNSIDSTPTTVTSINKPASTSPQSTTITMNIATPNIQQYPEDCRNTSLSNKALTHDQTKLPPSNVNFQSLLPTAVVYVTDVHGNIQPCRVLLDSGSQASFVTEECISRLGLPRQRATITIKGVGSSTAGTTRGSTTLQLTSRLPSQATVLVNALILPRISAPMPATTFNPECWIHLTSLQLADPTFFQPSPIDILIGAEYFFEILSDGKIHGRTGTPIAQNTIFGWVITGNIPTDLITMSVQSNLCAEVDIDQSLQRFWDSEELPTSNHLTEEEVQCETHFVETHRRTAEGRFVVQLPFIQPRKPLGHTRDMAIKRLCSMETKFTKCPQLKREYSDFMQEYIKLGHMERIYPTIPISNPTTSFYMPHHAVYKQSSTTTKLRVVFDASAKSSSKTSLNDNLMVGPTIQDTLFAILIRFRKHAIVFTSDIEKMYRQIRIAPEDANFQRIVWRESQELPVEDYQLLTVTYGTASAPYLATKALTTTADTNSTRFPIAAKIIKQDHLKRINIQTNEERPTTSYKLNVVISNPLLGELTQRYSKFSKLIRVIALLYHFSTNTKKSATGESRSRIILIEEYQRATNTVIKWVQESTFATEISCLTANRLIPKQSKLIGLNPFLDDHGLLRIGSRIHHAEIAYHRKFPIILPSNHVITDLIIDETHIKYLHAAQSLMIYILRQTYCILNCKHLVRQKIHRCVTCTRYKRQTTNQLMGDLPPSRVKLKHAFNQLQDIYKLNKSLHHNNTVSTFLLDHNTKWHFAPPSGPHFGGLYESAVKSMKFHLRRVLGTTTLNFEEMTTLLTQIEAILNSRPLCTLSSDHDDINALTPAHFILGRPLTSPPDRDITTTNINHLTRWKQIQHIIQHFWKRFYREYLTALHNRSKWQHKTSNLQVDDIVLIRDEIVPPAKWPLGKIVQTHPGADGLVRVVSIQTKSGIFKRPITKVSKVPVS